MKFKDITAEEYIAYREKSHKLAGEIMSRIDDDVPPDVLLHAALDIVVFILTTHSETEETAKQAIRGIAGILRGMVKECTLSGAARWSESPSDMKH